MTNQELKRRHRAVTDAIASQRLEGLEVDSQTISELERAADGELSVEEVLRSVKARIQAGEFRTKSNGSDFSSGGI
ncbi:antitoxin VbhA family protein [Pollutimonas bauzanensis]|uniref:Antitoxin VbhA domain-containing protein n=1 Tax=Pollutimonas bauzanensis TaxID=658167 RepID=A0A1M5YKD5_9BURK|nr:antitoxin VbhA family protein [Pollutimonas bauzanensis]SHI12481.1 hypothetical protein SAMN04488135_109182 [Pollutimonas bauzanensis]